MSTQKAYGIMARYFYPPGSVYVIKNGYMRDEDGLIFAYSTRELAQEAASKLGKGTNYLSRGEYAPATFTARKIPFDPERVRLVD